MVLFCAFELRSFSGRHDIVGRAPFGMLLLSVLRSFGQLRFSIHQFVVFLYLVARQAVIIMLVRSHLLRSRGYILLIRSMMRGMQMQLAGGSRPSPESSFSR